MSPPGSPQAPQRRPAPSGTSLLLRVSGVTLLDAHLVGTKPGYADYVRQTSAFAPRRPRE